jgi:predicted permease
MRSVNRTVGLSPKVGSLALYQFVPLVFFLLLVFYLKELLGFSWIVAAILVGFLSGLTMLFLGDNPSLFFSRLVKVPYVIRGGALYQPLL